MATRSTIAKIDSDGKVRAVYCHWDGYLSNNGKILLENYQDPAKVDALLSLGSISSLGPEIGEKHEFDCPFEYGTVEARKWSDDKANVTTFYGRDRGEDDVDCRVFESIDDYLANNQSEEFNYLMDQNGRWQVEFYGETGYLDEKLKEDQE